MTAPLYCILSISLPWLNPNLTQSAVKSQAIKATPALNKEYSADVTSNLWIPRRRLNVRDKNFCSKFVCQRQN